MAENESAASKAEDASPAPNVQENSAAETPQELGAIANQALQQKLRALEERFVQSLADKFAQMQAEMAQALQAGDTREHIVVLHRLLHSLAGSAGTFGFGLLGQKANQLELVLKDMLEGELLSPSKVLEFSNQLQEMLTWARNDPSGSEILVSSEQISNIEDEGHVATAPDDGPSRLVYVVDDDPLAGNDLTLQLQYFGYESLLINELRDLSAMMQKRLPTAIVIDMGFPLGDLAGALELARIKQKMGVTVPTIFISKDAGFEERLTAVRAGADSYFTKPVDVVALTDRLDALTAHHKKNPCRILIVDDDAYSAEYYGALLGNAGMEVRLLHEPKYLLHEMSEYRPELVLMDVYMPDCSGVELAQLLRQDNLYLDVPIVFLSSERNYGRQLLAIESGGDDFLSKPIRPNHLISSLASRVERYRLLRDLIVRDSLTGLYKHSIIKEMLEREMLRAQRSQAPLAFAMLDIDHFKQVNDTYGHPVGDQVIRALSRLLQQRLRRVEIIGRYGGEEFAVIFPDTTLESAAAVLNKVRLAFGQIRHHSGKGDFNISFSAGVVGVNGHPNAKSMLIAADEALYCAKGNGRNRIEIEVKPKSA